MPSARDGGPDGCETTRVASVLQPLGVYIMVDQSSSMVTLWDPVVSALDGFVDDMKAFSGVSIGIQYFALTPTESFTIAGIPITWTVTACTPDAYATPDVPIAPLPQNRDPIFESLATHGPTPLAALFGGGAGGGGNGVEWLRESPTDSALAGAIQGARTWYAAHENENPRAVVLLVTDGVPNTLSSPQCNASLANTVTAAKNGLQGEGPGGAGTLPSIPTYVLGVGGQVDALNQIAQAGGTESAYLVDADAGAGALTAALQNIRDLVLPCEIDATADSLARGDVNLEAGGSPLVRVAKNACVDSPDAREWYVDPASDAAPIRAELCPATCQALRAVSGETLEVVYGCPTVVAR
jgi:hypothetical protein